MDGGVADTARANTTVLTQAVNRRSLDDLEGNADDAHFAFTSALLPTGDL